MCASVGKKWYFLRKIWRDFFSYNNRFEIRPFALFKMTFAQQASRGVFRALPNMYDEAFFSRKEITALFFCKKAPSQMPKRVLNMRPAWTMPWNVFGIIVSFSNPLLAWFFLLLLDGISIYGAWSSAYSSLQTINDLPENV